MNAKYTIVRECYNRIYSRYSKWARTVRIRERTKYIQYILKTLPKDASVLDIGCGDGSLTTQKFAKRFKITGLDISLKQIEAAKRNNPTSTFVLANVAEIDFPKNTFHGIISFYCFNHIPRSEYKKLFQKIIAWIKPGGFFISSFGIGDCGGTIVDDWLGEKTYFSSFSSETTLSLITKAGFNIKKRKIERDIENKKPVDFLWVSAQKYSNSTR